MLWSDYALEMALAPLVVFFSMWWWYERRRNKAAAAAAATINKLTPEEEDDRIAAWVPEPLVPVVDPSHFALNPRVVSNYGHEIVIDGRPCLDLATHDYLGLARRPECIEAAIEATRQFGVGSCGPRGFFGTVNVHVELEKNLATFMETEEAVLYSYGYAAISSAIPAYAKPSDVIFVDENANFAIQQGIVAARSKVYYFKHNDLIDLQRLLERQQADDAQRGRQGNSYSRFIIVEGLYANTGDVCPLPELVKLKKQYKARLFIDDSIGFGVLGATGRGVVQHFGVSSGDVDMIVASLENAAASYGGFCAGSHFIIDHQRLSGLGYCFSASLPPLQTAVGIKSIELMQQTDIVPQLAELCRHFHRKLLASIDGNIVSVQGDACSPVKHLRFTPIAYLNMFADGRSETEISFEQQTQALEKVVNIAFEKGFALAVARYLDAEHCPPTPSIRLIVSVKLSKSEVTDSIEMLENTFKEVYNLFANTDTASETLSQSKMLVPT